MRQVFGCVLFIIFGAMCTQWLFAHHHGLMGVLLMAALVVWLLSILKSDVRADTGPGATLGSARFGGRVDLKALATNDGDLLIGRDTRGRLLRYDALPIF